MRIVGELVGTAVDLTFGAARLRAMDPIPGLPVPVLVLPGLLADDLTTYELRRYLSRCGHTVEPWRLGRNLGPTDTVLAGITERLTELHNRTGQPVTIVGWSLGGIYARWLAHQHPHMVGHVVALGSPWAVPQDHVSPVAHVLRGINSVRATHIYDVLAVSRRPLLVASTAIWSRGDGVVDWRHCLETAPHAVNVEVTGSHCGLTHNPAVAVLIAKMLARYEARTEGAAA